MKLIRSLLLITSLTLCAFAPVGCSTSQQSVAFKSASATQVTVDAAMTAWGDYVRAFHPPDSQRAQVRDLFNRYKACTIALIDAEEVLVSLNNSTNAPAGDVASATNNQAAALTAASQALADLVDAIRSFGVKM